MEIVCNYLHHCVLIMFNLQITYFVKFNDEGFMCFGPRMWKIMHTYTHDPRLYLDLFIFISIKNVHGTYFSIKLQLVYLKITYAMNIHRVQWNGNEHAMLYIKEFDVVTCLELTSIL